MLAAEFHYLSSYVDEFLDLEDLVAHMEYRSSSPPIGALFKMFLESFMSEEEREKQKQKESKERKPVKQKVQYIEDFIADFTGGGGMVR